jgi:hypothetical protein
MRSLGIRVLIPMIILIFVQITSPMTLQAGHEYIPPSYYLDYIAIKPIENPNEAAQAIYNGSIHAYLEAISYDEYKYIRSRYPMLGFARVDLEDIYMILSPSLNRSVRHAISLAINRTEISEAVFEGEARSFIVPTPPINPLNTILEDFERRGHDNVGRDPNELKGLAIDVVYYSTQNSYIERIARSISAQLNRFGVSAFATGIRDLADLENRRWHVLLVSVKVDMRGDLIGRILAIYREDIMPRAVVGSEDYRVVSSCWRRLGDGGPFNIGDLYRCAALTMERSIVVGVISIPGYHIYSREMIENAVIDPQFGLLSYAFFRTARLKDYPVWGGSLVIGVSRINYTVNPLLEEGTVNRILRLSIYDLPVFQEPYTRMPVYDHVIPIDSGERVFSDLLGPYKQCTFAGLYNVKRVSQINASAKLYPYHDGSMPVQRDLDSWRSLARKIAGKDPGVSHELVSISSPAEAMLSGTRVVEKTESAGNETIREYVVTHIYYRLSSSAELNCYNMQYYIFFPPMPWELSLSIERFLDMRGYLPDLIRDADLIAGIARSIARDMEIDYLGRARVEKLIMWVGNTSTALIGNGPYYVDRVEIRGKDIVGILLKAYRYERTYWGTAGDLDIIPAIYMWMISDAKITRSSDNMLRICFWIVSNNTLTQILIGNGVLSPEITLLMGNNIYIVNPIGEGIRCGEIKIDRGALGKEIVAVPLSFYQGKRYINLEVTGITYYAEQDIEPKNRERRFVDLEVVIYISLAIAIVAMAITIYKVRRKQRSL